jgi:hypothetical protein
MANSVIDLEQGEGRFSEHSATTASTSRTASQSFIDIDAKQESAEDDSMNRRSPELSRLPRLQKQNSALGLPAFGGDRPYPPAPDGAKEAFAVDFDGPTDPVHPLNWPFRTK